MSPSAFDKRSKTSDYIRPSSFGFHSSRNSDTSGRHLRRRHGGCGHQAGQVASSPNHVHHQPSAPPMYLVMSDEHPARDGCQDLDANGVDHYRNWGPPPRYHEAIAESRTSGGRPSTPIRSIHQQHHHHHHHHHQQRQQSCLLPPGYGVACHTGARRIPNPTSLDDHSDAPPSGPNSEQTTELGGRQEKRKTGSKIMKGLERAAFFVIQLLD